MRQIYFWIASVLLCLGSCMPYEEDVATAVKMDYSDKELQKIITYKDKRQTDSLAVYLHSKNPTYRYSALMGFASAKDTHSLNYIYPLLADPVDNVRGAAAYAIGQIGDTLSSVKLVKAFEVNDSLRQFNFANSQILEAVGKCGNEKALIALTTPTSFTNKDTLLLLGQTRGIYRMANRKMIHPRATRKMMEYAKNKQLPKEIRLMAAHYLHRAKGIKIDSTIAPICANIRTENDPDIRMALVTGIAKSKLNFAKDTLISLLKTEEDYRVQCNIIRALSFFSYPEVAPVVYSMLVHENPHVAMVAADYFYHNGISEEGNIYRNLAKGNIYKNVTKKITNPLLKARLLAAANKNLSVYFTQSKSAVTYELQKMFDESEKIEEKTVILDAMSEFEWTYPQMKKLGLDSNIPALESAGASGLAKILTSKNFDLTFGLGKKKVRQEIQGYLVQALKSKDAGAIAISAATIANPSAKFKPYFEENKGYRFLDTILQNISLPKEIETYKSVEKAIAYLDGKPTPDTRPTYNHPIEWDMVEILSHRTRAIIQTNKGKIVLSFFPQHTPASTSNFIRLAQDKYFDGIVIHRVVPNFVVQAGCNRGDGYGSLDYTIRSEFSADLNYDAEGYVGMASAGNDTEATQWFITHSPTPHLDGNYSIFAKVKDGMDVVHQLEVGDVIEKVVVKF